MYAWSRLLKVARESVAEVGEALEDQATTQAGLEFVCEEHEAAIDNLYYSAVAARMLARGVLDSKVKDVIAAMKRTVSSQEAMVIEKFGEIPKIPEEQLN